MRDTISLFLLSAACYTLPFIFPTLYSFLVLIFPLTLFVLLSTHISWQLLATWSLLVQLVHFLPLCDALIYMANGPLYLRIIPPIGVVIYASGSLFAWLFCTRVLLGVHPFYVKLTIWTISLWLYFVFIEYLLLLPFGRCEGYPFLNPLLPLAPFPSLLSPLRIIPMYGALLVFCLITSTIILLFFKKKSALLLFFLLFFLSPQENFVTNRMHFKTVGHLPLLLPASTSITSGSMLLAYELQNIHHRYPSVTLVILPESAWNGTTLNSVEALPGINNAIKRLIIGSFAIIDRKQYNRLYYFEHDRCIYHYDKQHAVPLTERPFSFFAPLQDRLFFQKTSTITASKKPCQPLRLPEIGLCIPYLCSELFCKNSGPPGTGTIIALINDWWFRFPHFQKLMALTARLRAISWGQSIFYVSFHYAQFFDPQGKSRRIATTPSDRFIP